MITEKELDAMQALCDLAAEGRWEKEWDGEQWIIVRDTRHEVARCLSCGCDDCHPKADAAFIAHAHADMPALIAEVRRLNKEATK